MLTPDDFATALPGVNTDDLQRTITNVEAMAAHFAPCIATSAITHTTKAAVVKAIMSKAVIYEMRSQDGLMSNESAGPFQHTLDKSVPQSSLYFSPQQIQELKNLCNVPTSQGPYSIPTVTSTGGWW